MITSKKPKVFSPSDLHPTKEQSSLLWVGINNLRGQAQYDYLLYIIKSERQKAQDEILMEVVHFIVDNQEDKECNYIIEFIGRLQERSSGVKECQQKN